MACGAGRAVFGLRKLSDLTDGLWEHFRGLLARVDATLSDGWFYEGADIYRHVWLVKTAPVHVKKWGTLATAKIQPGAAAVSIKTEVENHGKGAQNVRVISTLLDPAGKEVGKAATTPSSIAEFGERAYDQQVVVKQPALWSLEEHNPYRLVTEIEAGGAITDRYETRFGIRDLKFDPDQGFLLNGKSVKVKGTCNHQDHAGVGAALPDAVQYFRVRKLQEMGCNSIRTSHNPPTPELLNACDELGCWCSVRRACCRRTRTVWRSSRTWSGRTGTIPAFSCGRWGMKRAFRSPENPKYNTLAETQVIESKRRRLGDSWQLVDGHERLEAGGPKPCYCKKKCYFFLQVRQPNPPRRIRKLIQFARCARKSSNVVPRK